jgi:hypothetical protein
LIVIGFGAVKDYGNWTSNLRFLHCSRIKLTGKKKAQIEIGLYRVKQFPPITTTTQKNDHWLKIEFGWHIVMVVLFLWSSVFGSIGD